MCALPMSPEVPTRSPAMVAGLDLNRFQFYINDKHLPSPYLCVQAVINLSDCGGEPRGLSFLQLELGCMDALDKQIWPSSAPRTQTSPGASTPGPFGLSTFPYNYIVVKDTHGAVVGHGQEDALPCLYTCPTSLYCIQSLPRGRGSIGWEPKSRRGGKSGFLLHRSI